MRILIFLLVLANLLFYAFSHGLFGEEVGNEAANAQEINPQQVRILSRGEPPDVGAPPAEKPPSSQATGTSQDRETICLQWSNLPNADRAALQLLTTSKFSEFTWQEIPASAHSWWVFIPPLADRAGADKKAGELKSLGVKDYFIVQDGAQRHAISLGIFSSEKSANDHLAHLRNQGVRSAIVAARPDKSDGPVVRLRGPAEQQATLRSALAGTLADFPAQDCQ